MNIKPVSVRLSAPCAAVVVCLLSWTAASPTWAATYQWVAPSGQWHVATNWSPEGVPGPLDTAVLAGGTAFVSETQQVTRLELRGGTLSGSGTLQVSQFMLWTHGNLMNGAGRLVVEGGANLILDNTNAVELSDWVLENRGVVEWSGRAMLALTAGAVITNGGEFYLQNDQPILALAGNNLIENGGYWAKCCHPGTNRISAQGEIAALNFNNYGTLDVSAGVLFFDNVTFTQTETAGLLFFIGDPELPMEHGILRFAGSFAPYGLLHIFLNERFHPPPYAQWSLIQASSITREFDFLFVDPPGTDYTLLYSTNEVRLQVNHIPMYAIEEPGRLVETTLGQTEEFAFRVTGNGPLGYQWYFNGVPIPGASQRGLIIPNVGPAHAGEYFCVATNAFESLTSQVSRLIVVHLPQVLSYAYDFISNQVVLTIAPSPTFPRTRIDRAYTFPGGMIMGEVIMTNESVFTVAVDIGPTMESYFLVAAVSTNPPSNWYYATNFIGFARVFVSPGYNLIAVPFQCPNMSLAGVFEGAPLGSQFIEVTTNGFVTYTHGGVGGNPWSGPGNQPAAKWFRPLEGGYFRNPELYAFPLTFLGEVPRDNLTNVIPAGKSILSPLLPGGGLNQFPAQEGDKVWFYDSAQQIFRMHRFHVEYGDWYPPLPYVSVGTAFWCEPANPPTNGAPARVWAKSAAWSPWQYTYHAVAYGGGMNELYPYDYSAEPPQITWITPAHNVYAGQELRITTSVSGWPPLSYQWYFMDRPIAGATNNQLVINNAQPTNAGPYFVVVTGIGGAATSAVVTVSVNMALPDLAFAPRPNGSVKAMAFSPDGKLWVGGHFSNLGGQFHSGAGRLLPDGRADASFAIQMLNAEIQTLNLLPDGGWWVGGFKEGFYPSLMGELVPSKDISKFLAGDQHDPDFWVEFLYQHGGWDINSLLPLPDGLIIAGGDYQFDDDNGSLLAFNPDGSRFHAFAPGISGRVTSLALQPDDKLIVGGQYLSDAEGWIYGLERLLPGGSRDEAFNPIIGVDIELERVNAIALQTDGKILVGGFFESVNGQPRTNLARLHSDGTLDESFVANTDGEVYSILLQADGKIIIAGSFSRVRGSPLYNVARLHPDGTVDYQFVPDFSGTCTSLALDSKGNLAVGGDFYFVNDMTLPYLALLRNIGPAQDFLEFSNGNLTWWRNGAVPEVSDVKFLVSTNGLDWSPLGPAQRIAGGWLVTNVPYTPAQASYRALGQVRCGIYNGSSSWVEQGAGRPWFAVEPRPQQVMATARVDFESFAQGAGPISYQWYSTCGPLPGATTPSLTFTNVPLDRHGCSYWVVASNAFGSVTSRMAHLEVVPPSLGRALNATQLVWTTGGDAPWVVQTQHSADGEAAVQTAPLLPGQSSWLETTVNGPGWVFMLASYLNDYNDMDTFLVTANNQQPGGFINYMSDWHWLNYAFPRRDFGYTITNQGPTTIRIHFFNATAQWNGGVAVDAFRFIPASEALPPLIVNEPQDLRVPPGQTAVFDVYATGDEPMSYQWFFQDLPIPGANAPQYTIAAVQPEHIGSYFVVVSNYVGSVTSRMARLELEWPPSSQVYAWGFNVHGQTNVPPGLSNVVAVAGGFSHSMALRADGTVVVWATNNFGQTNVPVGLFGVVGIAAGGNHCLALRGDGTVVAWGDGARGETNVPTGLFNVVAVAAGWHHNLALQADGTVVAWGDNDQGQCNVPPGLSNVIAIAAGGEFSLALKGDGTVVAWGENDHGQATVPPGLSNVVLIAARVDHALALKSDGAVVAWGNNAYGQCDIPPGLGNVVALAAGHRHSVALKSDGTLVLWGTNDYGQLNVPLGLSNVVAIAAGYGHNLALVGQGIPFVHRQVFTRSASPGDTVVFSVSASGQWPLHYQWQWMGMDLPGANRPWLVLSNVAPIDAGHYAVVITNEAGQFYQNYYLQVETLNAPFITRHPEPQVALLGGSVTFTVEVEAAGPVGYLWLFNNQPIPGATGPILTLTNLTLEQQGYYSVRVSNIAGEDTSLPAQLTVIPQDPFIRINGVYKPDGRHLFPDASPVFVSILTTFTNGIIYYSTNSLHPDDGRLYTGPFSLTPPVILKVIAYNGDRTQWTPVVTNRLEVGTAFPLSVSTPGGGAVAVSPQPGPYASNTVVTLTASPAPGWSFLQWTGDAAGTNPVLQLVMNRPRNVTAVFGTRVQTLITGSGTVLQDPPDPWLPFGAKVRLSALPAAGSYFQQWGGFLTGQTLSPATLQLTNPQPLVTAAFATLPPGAYALNILIEGQGQVQRAPQANYYPNQTPVLLTATPAPGYYFAGWIGDLISTNPVEGLVMNNNRTITARFAQSGRLAIIAHPRSLIVNESDNAVFEVKAVGESLSYQWYYEGEPLPGATSALLALMGVGRERAGAYHVVVSNSTGWVASQTAWLTVNRLPNPQLSATLFLGTQADEAALALAVRSNAVYIGGISDTGVGRAFAAHVPPDFNTNTPPVWQRFWPANAGAAAFHGALALEDGVVFAGYGEPMLLAAAMTKGFLVQLSATNGAELLARQTPDPSPFVFNGMEMLHAIAASAEPAGSFWYVTGQGQNRSDNYGRMLLAKVTPGGSNVWVFGDGAAAATDGLLTTTGPLDFNAVVPVEYSVGRAVAVMGGAVYVAGRSDWDGVPYATLWKFSLDGRLLWQRTSGEGEYLGLTAANGALYAVGYAPDFFNGDNFLAEKWSPAGELLWTAIHDRAQEDDALTGALAVQTTNGPMLYACGYTYGGTVGGADAVLLRFDAQTGELLSTRLDGHYQDDFAHALAVQGNFIYLAGETTSGGAGGSDAVLLRFFDPDLVSNFEPSVVLTSPPDNAAFVDPANITLAAAASDRDGAIARVEFYQDGVLVGMLSTPPYTLVVSNLPAGKYEFQARAYDNLGALADSPPVSVTVNNFLVSHRLDFEGVFLGLDGVSTPLSLSNYLRDFEARVINLTPASTVRVVRASQVYPGLARPSSGSNFLEHVSSGRGAVTNRFEFDQVLESVQFTRVAVTAGPAGASHPRWRARAFNRFGLELSTVGENALFSPQDIPARTFHLTGPDIAAVVFESEPSSQGRFTSLLMDDLVLNVAVSSNSAPSVAILSPPNKALFISPATVTVQVRAEDFDGQVSRVELHVNDVLAQSAGNSLPGPFQPSFSLVDLAPGMYRLTARAIDNAGAVRESAPVNIFVVAPPPPNDQFANRLPLAGMQAVYTGNSAWATFETEERQHAATPGGRSVWFTWTAPQDGMVSISTEGSSFDTLLAVYTGTNLPTLVEIASNDDAPQFAATLTSRVVFNARRGQAYQIVVDGYNGAGGPYTLTVSMNLPPLVAWLEPLDGTTLNEPATATLRAEAQDTDGIDRVEFFRGNLLLGVVPSQPPASPFQAVLTLTNLKAGDYFFHARAVDTAGVYSDTRPVRVRVQTAAANNDFFVNARLLTGSVVLVTDNNRGATREPAEPNPWPNERGGSLWYRWTAPASGTILVSTLGSSFDTLLAVYTGTALNNLTLVALDDDSGDEVAQAVGLPGVGASLVTLPVTAGTTYYLAVEGFMGAAGEVRLSLAFNLPPTVALTINTNLAQFTAPGIIPLVATALDDQAVKQVDFFLNDELIGSVTNPVSSTSLVATLTLTNLSAGADYTFQARAIDDLGAVRYSAELEVEIQGAGEEPSLLAGPEEVEVLRGARLELTVRARGTPPLRYQWFFNGTPLFGATNATLVIPQAMPGNSGVYFARVSNLFGSEDGEATVVRVYQPPLITAPPASLTLPPGATAVFTVAAAGTPPLRYQWYRNQVPVAGATQPTLVLTNVSPWSVGPYTVVVSNRAGVAQATAQLAISADLAPPDSLAREDVWVTDGPVHALAEQAGTVYLGGNFRLVGPNTGLGAALDPASALPDMAFPRVEGAAIYAVVPDGRGGWFIGGDFSRVGGLPRTNLAHVLPDKTVDPLWTIGADRPVRALLLADEILYVGGEFTRLGGQALTNLAAIRTQDRTLRNFAPNPDQPVLALAMVGGKLYVGGAFTRIGGVDRARLAKLDTSDGQVRSDFNIGVDRTIHALAGDGNTLFVAGEFDTLTNNNVAVARAKIAAIDTEERTITGWSAPLPAGGNTRVFALALDGDNLYAGGDFVFTSGGVTYRHLAAFGRADGALRRWNPNAGGVVRALTVGGGRVYAGGQFLTLGGQSRSRLAAIDPVSGAVLGWHAPANGAVRALAYYQHTLYAGGQFTIVGGVQRSNLAAIRLATGQATSWNPGANGVVHALLVSGTNVYAGGEFTQVGAAARNRLAAISALSGAATAWNSGADNTVRALALAGKRLLVGGDFSLLAGAARSYLGAVDTDTAQLLDWNPAPDGAVLALAATASGDRIYAAGQFVNFNGLARPYLARINAGGGVEDWNPAPNGVVASLALRESAAETTLYAGGYFSAIAGVPAQRLAALNDAGAVLPAFAASVSSSTGDVAVARALALSESTLYVGGWFDRAGAEARQHLAACDVNTGSPAVWDPALTVPSQALGVRALAVTTNIVYAGGDFTRVRGDWRPHFAVFAPRGAPFIVSQPRGRPVQPGDRHTLSVVARGAWPVYFQWRLNGVNLPGATNDVLVLTNIQAALCGAYSVVVSTPFGVVESQPAEVMLDVPVSVFGDRFTNSLALPTTASGLVIGSNVEATGLEDDQLPSGFKRGGRSVWATWTAPTNGVVTFTTLGSTFDTLLAAFQGDTLNTLMLIERDEDSAGNLNETITFPVTEGHQYHLLLDGVEGATGTLLLSWNLLVGETDYPIITDQPRSRTVAENTAVSLQVTAQNAAAYQWYFRGQPIAGATNASFLIAALGRHLAGPYHVVVSGVNPLRRAQSRVFVLEVGQIIQTNQPVTLEDVRTHDKFDDVLRGGGLGGQTLGGPERQFFASVSAGSSGTQVLDNYGATTEPNEPNHGGVQGGASRWFRIDALTNGVLVIDTIGSQIDTVLAVYRGQSLLSLQLVASDDNGAPDGVRSVVRFNATAGQSYLIAVDGKNGEQGQIIMNYLLALPPTITTPPVNQSVAAGGTVSFNVTAAGTAPLTYQWYHQSGSQTNALPVAGGTNATLVLTNVLASDAGQLHVVVANPAGSVTSAVATLTVEAPLRFAAAGSSSYTNGAFTLNLSGKAGQVFVIQASSDLTTWTPIRTNIATGGQFQFTDPAAGSTRRYYRAVGLD